MNTPITVVGRSGLVALMLVCAAGGVLGQDEKLTDVQRLVEASRLFQEGRTEVMLARQIRDGLEEASERIREAARVKTFENRTTLLEQVLSEQSYVIRAAWLVPDRLPESPQAEPNCDESVCESENDESDRCLADLENDIQALARGQSAVLDSIEAIDAAAQPLERAIFADRMAGEVDQADPKTLLNLAQQSFASALRASEQLVSIGEARNGKYALERAKELVDPVSDPELLARRLRLLRDIEQEWADGRRIIASTPFMKPDGLAVRGVDDLAKKLVGKSVSQLTSAAGSKQGHAEAVSSVNNALEVLKAGRGDLVWLARKQSEAYATLKTTQDRVKECLGIESDDSGGNWEPAGGVKTISGGEEPSDTGGSAEPATPVVDEAATVDALVNKAIAAHERCDFVTARWFTDQLAAIDPGNPFLEANHDTVIDLATRQEITVGAVQAAIDAINRGNPTGAFSALDRVRDDVPTCMWRKISGVYNEIRKAARSVHRQEAAARADSWMQTLVDVTRIVGSASGRGGATGSGAVGSGSQPTGTAQCQVSISPDDGGSGYVLEHRGNAYTLFSVVTLTPEQAKDMRVRLRSNEILHGPYSGGLQQAVGVAKGKCPQG